VVCMNTLVEDEFEDRCTECGASFEFHMTHRYVVYPVLKHPLVACFVSDDELPLLNQTYDYKVCYSYKMNVR
jgi:hypothetical protein